MTTTPNALDAPDPDPFSPLGLLRGRVAVRENLVAELEADLKAARDALVEARQDFERERNALSAAREKASVAAQQRSYGVRREIAQTLGKPEHHDFSCRMPVVLDDGRQCVLLSTSNAGFRGIEGYFEDCGTDQRFSTSLGHVVEWVR